MCNISVIGGSSVDEEYCSIAYDIGRLLSERGCIVVCGGLTGVMECVAKGVKDSGGISVGILPGTSLNEGNRYLTVKIPTGIGFARNFLVVRAGEAVISVDGSSGTRSEAYFAISEGKSVVSIGDLSIQPRKPTEGKFFKASDPSEAVEIAIREARLWSSKPRPFHF